MQREPTRQLFKVRRTTEKGVENRRFRLEVHEQLYDSLVQQVKTLFGIPNSNGMKMFYSDEEGDRVLVSAPIDLEAAVSSAPRVLTLEIEEMLSKDFLPSAPTTPVCAPSPVENSVEDQKPTEPAEETRKKGECWWKGDEWEEIRRETLDSMLSGVEENLQQTTEKLNSHPEDQHLKLEKMVCESKKEFLEGWIGGLPDGEKGISVQRCVKFWHGMVVASLKAHREFQAENGGSDKLSKKLKGLEVKKACLELGMALI